jgi:hypothetical protein
MSQELDVLVSGLGGLLVAVVNEALVAVNAHTAGHERRTAHNVLASATGNVQEGWVLVLRSVLLQE